MLLSAVSYGILRCPTSLVEVSQPSRQFGRTRHTPEMPVNHWRRRSEDIECEYSSSEDEAEIGSPVFADDYIGIDSLSDTPTHTD